jgi:hypothetical protein
MSGLRVDPLLKGDLLLARRFAAVLESLDPEGPGAGEPFQQGADLSALGYER